MVGGLMAVTPAYIKYRANGADQFIRFHAVVSEGHEASTQITSYPTQTGFQISNHSIRKNRKVSINAIITNTLIKGGATSYEYSNNNSKDIFEALESLVNSATPCEVVTNLTVYKPVIFSGFKTTQTAGLVDAIDFTLSGEEVMVASTIARTAPKVLQFDLVPATDIEKVKEELRKANINVDEAESTEQVKDLTKVDAVSTKPRSVISQAKGYLGEDFSFESTDATGNPIKITYICTGLDYTTNTYTYDVHTDDTETVNTDKESLNLFGLEIDPSNGVSAAGACFVDRSTTLLEDTTNDVVKTAQGELQKSVYGAYYKAVNLLGDSDAGQAIMGLAIDCITAGAVGTIDPGVNSSIYDTSLPTVEDMIGGAKVSGNQTVNNTGRVLAPVTFTKVSRANNNFGFFGG